MGVISTFLIELAIEKPKSHKSSDIDQIQAELTKAGCRTIRYEIHILIISIWNKEELFEEWKESIILLVYKKGDKAYFSKYRGIALFAKYIQNFIQHPAVKANSICRGNYWGS